MKNKTKKKNTQQLISIALNSIIIEHEIMPEI